MDKITLTLTLEEANALLDALGSQPFKQVHQLIAKIQSQATSQLQGENGQSGSASEEPQD